MKDFTKEVHSPKAKKRALAVVKAMAAYLEGGIIPPERIQEAVRAASIASGRVWTTTACRTFAMRMKYIDKDP